MTSARAKFKKKNKLLRSTKYAEVVRLQNPDRKIIKINWNTMV